MFQNNLLMGAAAAASGGASVVSVGNSALFDAGASTDGLSYTTDGSGWNQKTFTLSTWFYLGSSTASIGGVGWPLFSADHGSGNSETTWWKVRILNTTGQLVISNWNDVITTQVFRDTGWYHLVIGADTRQAVASERYQAYVNGKRISAFGTTNYPSQNIDLAWGEPSEDQWIGNYDSSAYAYNGYLAETVFKSGSQLGADSFGAYDSSGLYWTPKSSDDIKALSPTFYLDNATNPQTDASGNGVNWTNNGSIGTSKHTPTNMSALLNSLNKASTVALSKGNTEMTTGVASIYNAVGTIPMKTGKYYFEVETVSSDATYPVIGVTSASAIVTGNSELGDTASGGIGYRASGAVTKGGSTIQSYASWSSATNIAGCAYDADTGKVWFRASAGWNGDPAAGSGEAGTLSATDGEAIFGVSGYSGAIPRAIFEEADWTYSAPTGFSALNTTNIAAATTRTASDTTKYFDTILYEGNGVGQRVGQFQPFDNSFTVGNGALFDYANNEILKRTNSSAGNSTKFTFSTWAKFTDINAAQIIFGSNAPTISPALWFGDTTRRLYFTLYNGNFYAGGGSYVMSLLTDPLPNDPTQWMHIVAKYDSTVSTPSASSIAIYVNGVQQGLQGTELYPGQNQTAGWNSDAEMLIGTAYNSNLTVQNLRAYLAETVNIDGLALEPSSFAQTDTTSGRWIPKDVSGLTFGTNGFYLNYANSSDVGNDVSGNNNDWTNVNTVTQVSDSPTINVATLNPNTGTVAPLSNGNRTVTSQGAADNMNALSTIPLTGKVYFEFQTSTLGTNCSAGLTTTTYNFDDLAGGNANSWGWVFDAGDLYYSGNVASSAPSTLANGVRGCIALDMDTGSMWTGQVSSGTITWDNSGNPETGANPLTTQINTSQTWYALISGRGSSVVTAYFASADWTGSTNRPASFKALTQDNIASSDQFISAFSWIKNRDATDNHMLFDRVRGPFKDLHSNDTPAEVTNVQTVQQFLAGGVQVGNDVEVNTANESYVLWNWMIETTGSGSSNEDGSINTTSTLVDTTLGLSISKYTGTGSNATVGHGLGVAPNMMLIKNLGVTDAWAVYYGDNTDYLVLNTAASTVDDATMWNDTTPTSSVFSIGSNHQVNASSENYIAYCFANSQFISIGSYTNNNSTDGTYVPTINSLGVPLQPVWILTKTFASAEWMLNDAKRIGYNVDNNSLYPAGTTVESTADVMDIVTGGFKLRTSNDPNYSTSTTIYMAIGTPIIDTDGRIIAGR